MLLWLLPCGEWSTTGCKVEHELARWWKIPRGDYLFGDGTLQFTVHCLYSVRGGVPYSRQSDFRPIFRTLYKPNNLKISRKISTLLVSIEPSMVLLGWFWKKDRCAFRGSGQRQYSRLQQTCGRGLWEGHYSYAKTWTWGKNMNMRQKHEHESQICKKMFKNKTDLLEDHFKVKNKRAMFLNGFSNWKCRFKIVILGLIDAVFRCGCVLQSQ